MSTSLRLAGPLSLDGLTGAIFHASCALLDDPVIPGTTGPIPIPVMWTAALNAIDPYCDGDRAGATEAIADELTPGWRTWSPASRRAAVAEGDALLVWLEGFDPARN